MTDYCLLYVTCASVDEAQRIARALVKQRLVACANILPAMQSIYEWEGELCESAEAVLILKTRLSLADVAGAAILAAHSYTCPCILQLPIAGGHTPFLNWLGTQIDHPDASISR